MLEFFDQFSKVFNADYSIRNCGRDETIKLIKICSDLDKQTYYGNLYSGIMNVDAVVKLYKSLTASS
jgi:hypothetical protein